MLGSRKKYTKRRLIQYLQNLTMELGRRPTSKEIDIAHKKGGYALAITFNDYFGGIDPALKIAGLETLNPGPKKRYTHEQLIRQGDVLAKKLKRKPTKDELEAASKKGRGVCPKTILKYFGKWSTYKKFISVSGKRKHAKKTTHEQLLQQLRSIGKKKQQKPKVKDIIAASKKGQCESIDTFIDYFGYISTAVICAGPFFNNNPKKVFHRSRKRVKTTFFAGLRSDEQKHKKAFELYEDLALSLGRIPTRDEMTAANKKGICCSARTLDRMLNVPFHEVKIMLRKKLGRRDWKSHHK